jgi:hypothetical protein
LIAGEHDVAAFGQGSADRFVGFPSHHDRVAGGGFFEKREVFRQMPRQCAIAADHPLFGHGDNRR